jgi:hypothetical protein
VAPSAAWPPSPRSPCPRSLSTVGTTASSRWRAPSTTPGTSRVATSAACSTAWAITFRWRRPGLSRTLCSPSCEWRLRRLRHPPPARSRYAPLNRGARGTRHYPSLLAPGRRAVQRLTTECCTHGSERCLRTGSWEHRRKARTSVGATRVRRKAARKFESRGDAGSSERPQIPNSTDRTPQGAGGRPGRCTAEFAPCHIGARCFVLSATVEM